MTHRPLVFLDIETTGFSPSDARITEIGAVRVENGDAVGTFSQLVNPVQTVPVHITRLTGIDDALVADAPAFVDIFAELATFLEGAVFVAHNVDFDYSFLQAECARIPIHFSKDRFCTARLSRRLYPTQLRHNLDTLIRVHGITVKNRHRALDDAQVLFDFYRRALNDHQDKVYATIERIMICPPKARRQSHAQKTLSLFD